jgi:hypothetical protein
VRRGGNHVGSNSCCGDRLSDGGAGDGGRRNPAVPARQVGGRVLERNAPTAHPGATVFSAVHVVSNVQHLRQQPRARLQPPRFLQSQRNGINRAGRGGNPTRPRRDTRAEFRRTIIERRCAFPVRRNAADRRRIRCRIWKLQSERALRQSGWSRHVRRAQSGHSSLHRNPDLGAWWRELFGQRLGASRPAFHSICRLAARRDRTQITATTRQSASRPRFQG